MRHKRKLHRREARKQKRILIISLFTVLLCLTVGYASFSTNINLSAKGNIYNKGDLCYETSDNGDGTVTITDYDKSCGSEVNIPNTIKGKTVTKIGNAGWGSSKVFNHKSLTKVTIPDTVTYIGTYAFSDNQISNLDLGTGVQKIGTEAFLVNKLTNITFPKSLTIINSGAFIYNNLTSIPPLDNISYGDGAFSSNNLKPEEAFIYSKNIDGTIDYTTLNSYASKTYIDTLNIPSNIKIIKGFSLRHISAGTITFSEGFEKVSAYSIMQTHVTTINLPSTTKEIDNHAFEQSTDIKTININRTENAIEGAPWGATNATVNWTGTD